VESVRNGHRAAKTIAEYIETGNPLSVPSDDMNALGDLPDEMVEKIRSLKPVETDIVAPEIRIKGFSEIERGFTEPEAHAEARRCLSCTTGAHVDEEKCAACLTCVRMCPFGVATVDKTAIMPEEKCQACGLCAAACPAAAIALKRFGTNQMKDQLTGLAEEIKDLPRPFIVSYCCLFLADDREFILDKREHYKQTGVYLILVPCVARLSVPDLLSPFEMGTDGLSIIGCSHDDCLYPTAEERLGGRVDIAKNVLEEVGVEPDRIESLRIPGDPKDAWPEYWKTFKNHLITYSGITEVKK
jgi:coenzyme F420-reducing hydrogenase delta subunit/ferredoxin